MRTVFLSALGIAALMASACGTTPPAPLEQDPVAMMRAADSATSMVQAVEYDFTLSGTGDLQAVVPPFHGTVRASRIEGDQPPLLNVTFLPDTLGNGDVLPDLEIASDGDSAWVLDRSAMMLTRGAHESGATDLLEFAFYALMIEYVVDDPFLSETEAESIAIEGVDSVAGVECDVVFVVYQDSGESARWFIGREDHLPRRVERLSASADMQGSQVLEIANLMVIDPAPGAETYRLSEIPPEILVEDYNSSLTTGGIAPDWTLETPEGESVTLSELQGSVVVLDFWATWCGPCAMAMPGLQAMSEEFADSAVVIMGVNVWEDGDPVAFMADNGYTYPIVLAGDAVADAYLVTGIPTFYVIGRDGRIAYTSRGYDPEGEVALRTQILEALAR